MTSRGNTLRAVALAAGAALVLAACGNNSDGTPTATGQNTSVSANASTAKTSPAKGAAPWDPCTLPDDAARASGLDPASKKQGTAGVEFDGWKSCDWRAFARWYNLGILAGTPTLADVQNRRDFVDFKPLSIANRRAVQFNLASDDDHLGCGVAVESPGGTVIFDMLGRYGEPQQEEPCTVAVRHASDLAKYLPNG
ncbi:DUF3558 domain-containing protein [Nocardia amamiensis]|uniref:DUF3558 domain-containing protein n=1 Tax=Nocardia amamiensis TaxID=404578 RepID=A0ABS0CX44_9NOCA|nr:DUF3558 domain-containing protein [Nocardia amamiensis]